MKVEKHVFLIWLSLNMTSVMLNLRLSLPQTELWSLPAADSSMSV